MKQKTPKTINPKWIPGTFYAYIGGSCDYAHEDRAGGGAYILEHNGTESDRFVQADLHTTEFRMMLSVMIHLMNLLEDGTDVVFLTNVAYLQNFDREPTDKSANADLIQACIESKKRLGSVSLKIVPYHKFNQLIETHDMAHEAMIDVRNGKKL